MQQDLKNSEGDGDLRMDVYGRSVKGGAWLIGLRAFMFVLSFIRLPILLRLLVPYDFGLLHIGTLMTGMVGSFTDFGLQSALVQRKHNTDTHLNVVWTVGILRGLVLFGILFFAAPYVAVFFDGTGHFADSHILNDRALVVRLRQGADPLSEYLAAGFSDSTHRLLDEYDDSAGVSGSLSEALVDELNEVVEGPDIYDEDRFAHVELSGYALALAQQPVENRDTVRFNRRLLDEAYAGLIKRDIMDRPLTKLVIQIMAVSVLLGGLKNVGTIYFIKDLEFNKRVIMDMSTQLVMTFVTIVLAFVYRNVWALVLGRLAGGVCGLALSYVMHPYRPRLSFDISRAKELWGFGKHMFGISILRYPCLNGDDIFLGKMLGATALGYYQKAFQIGNMVAAEIGSKVSMVAFPAYSKLQDNVAKLRSGYFKAVQATTLIVFPITGGLIALAPEITEIVFGAQWLPMVPAMQILCLFGPLRCLQKAPVFMAMGRPGIITRSTLIRFTLMAITIYPLTIKWGMAGTSLCVLMSGLVPQPIEFHELQKLIGAKARDVLKILSCPFFATLIMALCVWFAKSAIPAVGVVSLILLVGLGAGIYFILIILLSKIISDYDVLTLVRDVVKGLKS